MTKFMRVSMTLVTMTLIPFAMLVLGFKYAMEAVDEYVRGLR